MNFLDYRDRFPILKDKVHLANCSQAPQSVDNLHAITRYVDSLTQKGMDWDLWMDEVDKARLSFAELIHASIDEIAVVLSVSDAVSSVASSLHGTPLPHVLTTMNEFPTVGHVWLAHQRQGRLDVTFAEAPEGDYTPDTLAPHLTPNTKIISVHHVNYFNGAKQSLAPLAEFAHSHGAYLLVDAYQGLGACTIDVKETGIDMLTSGCLKYLLGIPGIAFLYVRKELAQTLEPATTGWFGRVNPFAFEVQGLDFADGARRFQTGTPPVAAAFVARSGMNIIHEAGPVAVAERVQSLSMYTMERALSKGLDVVGPRTAEKKGPTTAIHVPDAHDMEVYLAEQGIIASARGDVIRLAPHFFTLESDIDQAIDVIQGKLSRKI